MGANAMKNKLSNDIRYWIVWGWLCLESGSFFATRSGLEDAPLFWPFWIALFVALTLAIELVDRR